MDKHTEICRTHLQRLTDSKTLLFVILQTVCSVNDVFYLSDCLIQFSSCHIRINFLKLIETAVFNINLLIIGHTPVQWLQCAQPNPFTLCLQLLSS